MSGAPPGGQPPPSGGKGSGVGKGSGQVFGGGVNGTGPVGDRPGGGDGRDNTTTIVIVAACAGVALLAIIVALVVCMRRKRNKGGGVTPGVVPMAAIAPGGGDPPDAQHEKRATVVQREPWPLQRKYAAFLSHYKAEAASDARYLKSMLEASLSAPVFLDSDDLQDLRALVKGGVDASDVVLLLQTSGVLTRPWCLVELYKALKAGIPVVAVAVRGSFPYDYGEASAILKDLADTEHGKLAQLNPGAHTVIREEGQVDDLEDMQRVLSRGIPALISKAFDPSATRRMIDAQVEDICDAMVLSKQGRVVKSRISTNTTVFTETTETVEIIANPSNPADPPTNNKAGGAEETKG